MKSFQRKKYLPALIVCVCLLSGCTKGTSAKPISRTDTAMGTIIQQNLYVTGQTSQEDGQSIAADVSALIGHLESDILSWRLETSQICRVNENAGKPGKTEIPEEFAQEMKLIFEVSEASGGALDVTIADVVRLWDIDEYAAGEKADFQLPQQEAIKKALEDTGFERVTLEGNLISLPVGMKLDLGAVGKGLACGRIEKLLKERPEVTGAVISVGGSVLTYGEKPDKTPWKVGILNPDQPGSYAGYLNLSGQWFISTSGDYERYVEVDGKRYHHIIDPSTGYPADSGVSSVTILGNDGLLTDALSTACFVLGVEDGLKLVQEYEMMALFIDQEGNLFMTDGMEKYFQEAE